MASPFHKVDPEVDRTATRELTKPELMTRVVACAARIRELDVTERIIIGSLNAGSVRTDIISAIANWRHDTKKRQDVLVNAILTFKDPSND